MPCVPCALTVAVVSTEDDGTADAFPPLLLVADPTQVEEQAAGGNLATVVVDASKRQQPSNTVLAVQGPVVATPMVDWAVGHGQTLGPILEKDEEEKNKTRR